jgi:hypothetical protein
MATSKRTPKVVEVWQELDWSNNGPYGAAVYLNRPLPCGVCGQPAWLLSPRKQTPMHKTCAQDYLIAVQLLPILAALGQVVPHDALP